jgi:hypothetical protein
MKSSNDPLMSAFGPKRTSLAAPHMSAFGGKADIKLTFTRRRPSVAGRFVFFHPKILKHLIWVNHCQLEATIMHASRKTFLHGRA